MAVLPRPSRSMHRRVVTFVLAAVVFVAGALYARPSYVLTIETGPVGGSYYQAALKYQAILAAKGIHLEIRTNPNSLEIVRDVANRDSGIDLGFIAQDVSDLKDADIYSLGQIELQPLFIFASAELGRRSTIDDLRGRKIVMPPSDSATSNAAMRVFQLYDITKDNSSFTFMPLAEAVKQLRAGRFDAGVFMLAPGNAAIRELANDTGLRLVPLAETKAVANHLPFLRPVVLPRGIYNIADAIPPTDTPMVAAPVGIVARSGLHTYVIFSVLEAMTKVHRGPSFISNAGEFPTMAGSQLTVQPIAEEYYTSGVNWIYRALPPWPASVVDNYLLLVVGLYLLSRVFIGLRTVTEAGGSAVTTSALWLLRTVERSTSRTGRLSAMQRLLVWLAEKVLHLSSRRHQSRALVARIRGVGQHRNRPRGEGGKTSAVAFAHLAAEQPVDHAGVDSDHR